MGTGASKFYEKLSYFHNETKPTLKDGELFTDPNFPPDKNSLMGLNSSGKPIDSEAYKTNSSSLNPNEIMFKRPSEIFKNKTISLFENEISVDDIKQGGLGDCYFLSSISALAKYPKIIDGIFKSEGLKSNGYYEIILYIDGKPQIVIIDDYIPVYKSSKQPCFARPNGNEIWVMLLEKAWAKVNGGYLNIIGGNQYESLQALTGFCSQVFDVLNYRGDDLESYQQNIFKAIEISSQHECLMTCATDSNTAIERVGLVASHAYTLLGYKGITSNGKTVHLLQIRNPHSEGEWNGDWSDSSNKWGTEEKKQVSYKKANDGTFFMEVSDFFNYFYDIEICHLPINGGIAKYKIDKSDIKNGQVFNIYIMSKCYFSVSVLRKQWRFNRELRGTALPTHISMCKYDPNCSNQMKMFSDYVGSKNSFDMCNVGTPLIPGYYLVYVYQDHDKLKTDISDYYEVRFDCSSGFKHMKMTSDLRDNGLPLLKNIILQAEIAANNYDTSSNKEFSVFSNEINNNGIGHQIYKPPKGYYMKYRGNPSNSTNYISIAPHTDKTFDLVCSSNKYLIVLSLIEKTTGAYCFAVQDSASITNAKLKESMPSYDINLATYCSTAVSQCEECSFQKIRERMQANEEAKLYEEQQQKEKAATEAQEKAKAEAERLAQIEAQKLKEQQEKEEQERLAKEKEEEEKKQKEKEALAEKEKAAQEDEELEKLKKEQKELEEAFKKAVEERQKKQKEKLERLEKQRKEREKAEKEARELEAKRQKEKAEKEAKELAEQEAKEAKEKAEQEAKAAKEKADKAAQETADKAAQEAKAAQEKAAQEAKAAQEKAAQEKAALEKKAQEAKAAQEKAAQEAKAAQEKAAQEAKAAKEKAEQEAKAAKEKAEQEKANNNNTNKEDSTKKDEQNDKVNDACCAACCIY